MNTNSEHPFFDEEKWINADKIQQDFIARSWCWNRYVELTKLTGIDNKNALKRHGISFTKHLPGGSKFRGSLQEVKDINDLAKNVSFWLESGANRTRM